MRYLDSFTHKKNCWKNVWNSKINCFFFWLHLWSKLLTLLPSYKNESHIRRNVPVGILSMNIVRNQLNVNKEISTSNCSKWLYSLGSLSWSKSLRTLCNIESKSYESNRHKILFFWNTQHYEKSVLTIWQILVRDKKPLKPSKIGQDMIRVLFFPNSIL